MKACFFRMLSALPRRLLLPLRLTQDPWAVLSPQSAAAALAAARLGAQGAATPAPAAQHHRVRHHAPPIPARSRQR